MNPSVVLVFCIGLFVIIAGTMYLVELRKNETVSKLRSFASWVIVALGALLCVWSITEAINSKIDVKETSSDLMGADAYKMSKPRNSGSHEDASNWYIKGVGLWNDNIVGYDSTDQTMEYLNRSISSFETAEAYTARGQLKVQLGMMQQALEDYNRSIELKDTFGNAYYNRASLYYIMGNVTLACADWKKANELGVPNVESVIQSMCN